MAHNLIRLLPAARQGLAGYISKRTRIFSSKKDVSRDLIAVIQQEIDLRPIAIRRWKKRQEWELLVKEHELNEDRLRFLGADLATAHFIIARGGAVRFHGIDHWFERETNGKTLVPLDVPNRYDPDWKLEAVDASDTPIMYCSFDNFGELSSLQYLALRGCPNINDWCLDRLHEFNHSLRVLDLSGCPNVTERGLAVLHRMSNLRRLIIADMPNVFHQSLVGLLLEEVMPNCVIEGIDFSQPPESIDSSNDGDINSNRDSFEKYEQKLFATLKEDQNAGTINIGKFTL